MMRGGSFKRRSQAKTFSAPDRETTPLKNRCFAAFVAAFMAACVCLHAPARAESPQGTPALLWGDLRPGSFAVGFRILYARDTSRAWLQGRTGPNAAASDPGRPIRISLWYPARPRKTARSMHYGDYFHFPGPASFRALNAALERGDRESWTNDLAEVSPRAREILDKLFATPVAAYRNAAMAAGRFPLILYSPGLGSRADANVELGEYLASHGYVVATIPQLGPSDRELSLGSSPSEIGLHVADMEFAMGVLGRAAGIDAKKIAVIGHSAGGIAALDFAMRHPDVRAVVGLDGSYGFKGGARIFKRIPDYAPEKVRAAILDMRRKNGVQDADLDLSVLEDCRLSDRYRVEFAHMFHGDFTEFGPIGLKLSVPLPPNKDGRTRQTGYDGNQHAYRAVLSFLEAELRDRRTALSDLVSEIRMAEGTTIAHEAPAAVSLSR